MKSVEFPSDSVLVIVARALPDGPKIDAHVNAEWWQAAGKDHRKALFVAAVTALGELGNRVIPEEFGPDAMRDLERLSPMRSPKLVEVLIAQVEAALVVVEAGGDLRQANLDDRLFTDRLRDTLIALRETT